MFSTIFGETEQEQIAFLGWRSVLTIIVMILAGIYGVFPIFGDVGTSSNTEITIVFATVMLFVWGWPALKKMFGITIIGILLTWNIVFGIVLFVFYLIIAYLVGILLSVIGVLRFLWLVFKRLLHRQIESTGHIADYPEEEIERDDLILTNDDDDESVHEDEAPVTCGKCGSIVGSDDTFCKFCGNDLRMQVKAITSDAESEEGFVSCIYCNARIKDSDKFCSVCGKYQDKEAARRVADNKVDPNSKRHQKNTFKREKSGCLFPIVFTTLLIIGIVCLTAAAIIYIGKSGGIRKRDGKTRRDTAEVVNNDIDSYDDSATEIYMTPNAILPTESTTAQSYDQEELWFYDTDGVRFVGLDPSIFGLTYDELNARYNGDMPLEQEWFDWEPTFDTYFDYEFVEGHVFATFFTDGRVSAIRYESVSDDIDYFISLYSDLYGDYDYIGENVFGAYGGVSFYVWEGDNVRFMIFNNYYDDVNHVAVQYESYDISSVS